MKLCIPIDKTPHTGKAFFLHRLIPELEELGVKVTLDKSKKVDITLGVGKFLYNPSHGKKVLRLGPAHVSTHKDYRKLNLRKARAVRSTDGVIYQSKFSKRMCDKFLGKTKKPTETIFNGAYIQKRQIKEPFTFICSTRKWIPQKRLKQVLKAWEICDFKMGKLFILGDTLNNVKPMKNVYFVGKCSQEKVREYLMRSEFMIHPVYLDAMPNSVVEALACGCRVIHTDSGGTKEVVGNNGIRIKDKPWDFKPINLLKPPKIDAYKLAGAMVIESEHKRAVSNDHIDIRNIAKQYKSFFEKVLRGQD